MNIAAALAKAPAPQEIDDVAEKYCDLEKQIEEIEAEALEKVVPLRARMTPLGDTLRNWGSQWGGAHATKSKLLSGLVYEVMTTAGSSTSLDQAAAAAFLSVCKKAGKSRTFRRLFEILTVYRARPDADQVARTLDDGDLAIGYTRCFTTKPLATRMEVRPRKKPTGAA